MMNVLKMADILAKTISKSYWKGAFHSSQRTPYLSKDHLAALLAQPDLSIQDSRRDAVMP